VPTDLSIAQTLVNNAVLKMRAILYQPGKPHQVDYTEMPTVTWYFRLKILKLGILGISGLLL